MTEMEESNNLESPCPHSTESENGRVQFVIKTEPGVNMLKNNNLAVEAESRRPSVLATEGSGCIGIEQLPVYLVKDEPQPEQEEPRLCDVLHMPLYVHRQKTKHLPTVVMPVLGVVSDERSGSDFLCALPLPTTESDQEYNDMPTPVPVTLYLVDTHKRSSGVQAVCSLGTGTTVSFVDRRPTIEKNLGKKGHFCEICGKPFTRSTTLRRHMVIHTGGKPHQCSHCGSEFTLKANLMRHLLIHSGETPYVCEICGKAFNQRGSLQKHAVMHSGLKLHMCPLCGKSFGMKDALNRHALVHTGEKSHNCNYCGKSFMLPCNLKTHMRIHTGEKPHVCKICGKRYRVSCSLKSHALVHTKEKAHKCEVCGKMFARRPDLNKHAVVHASEKPYICGNCGKAFSFRENMKRHAQTHTREKPCALCGKQFTQKCSVQRHVIKQHDGIRRDDNTSQCDEIA